MTKLQQLQTIIGLIILFTFALFIAVVCGVGGILAMACKFITEVLNDLFYLPNFIWSELTDKFNNKANA
jgi:hypothetical protein